MSSVLLCDIRAVGWLLLGVLQTKRTAIRIYISKLMFRYLKRFSLVWLIARGTKEVEAIMVDLYLSIVIKERSWVTPLVGFCLHGKIYQHVSKEAAAREIVKECGIESASYMGFWMLKDNAQPEICKPMGLTTDIIRYITLLLRENSTFASSVPTIKAAIQYTIPWTAICEF